MVVNIFYVFPDVLTKDCTGRTRRQAVKLVESHHLIYIIPLL